MQREEILPAEIPEVDHASSIHQNHFEGSDPFDLCALDYIPSELYEDKIFKKYICGINLVPVRYPCLDPKALHSDGKSSRSPIYEYSALVRWVQEKGTSPTTKRALAVEEIQPLRHIKRLIDYNLKKYSDQLREIAGNISRTIVLDPDLLLAAQREASQEVDERKE